MMTSSLESGFGEYFDICVFVQNYTKFIDILLYIEAEKQFTLFCYVKCCLLNSVVVQTVLTKYCYKLSSTWVLFYLEHDKLFIFCLQHLEEKSGNQMLFWHLSFAQGRCISKFSLGRQYCNRREQDYKYKISLRFPLFIFF